MQGQTRKACFSIVLGPSSTSVPTELSCSIFDSCFGGRSLHLLFAGRAEDGASCFGFEGGRLVKRCFVSVLALRATVDQFDVHQATLSTGSSHLEYALALRSALVYVAIGAVPLLFPCSERSANAAGTCIWPRLGFMVSFMVNARIKTGEEDLRRHSKAGTDAQQAATAWYRPTSCGSIIIFPSGIPSW